MADSMSRYSPRRDDHLNPMKDSGRSHDRDRDRPLYHNGMATSSVHMNSRDRSPGSMNQRRPAPQQSSSGQALPNNPGSNMNPSDQLTLRALVGTKEAGVIIGKQGANIKLIRESSNARVVVSEHMQGVPERIVSVTGAVDEIAKAYAQISRNLNQGDLRGNSADAVESTPLTLRYLIPHSRMGAVIGKGGARIKEIQEESNARLAATATPLPHSQDRILEMIGVPDAIHIATYHMLITIKEQSDRPCHDRPYRAEYGISSHGSHGGMGGMSGHLGPHMMHSGPQHGHQGYGGAYGGYAAGGGYGGMGHPGAGHGGPVETRTFYCPVDKVGPMIGKGGNRINKVRMETGCKINVEEAREGRGDRPFVIIGPPRDVELAMRTLEAHLRREFARDQERMAQDPAGSMQS